MLAEGRNEKEACRNLEKENLYLAFECPEIELLSVQPSLFKALAWRTNDNQKDRNKR